MRAGLALLLLTHALFAFGCEKRPPEPLPAAPPRNALPTLSTDQSAASEHPTSTRARTSDVAEPNRCVVPLPKTPPPVPPPASSCPPDPVFGGVRLPKATIPLPEGLEAGRLEVELAGTPEQHERGLMYRTSMKEQEGMLFSFGAPDVHTFWMHNTCIPLDMLFIAADGFITGVVESAPTLNDGPRSIPCPVSYVLEVNAGWVRRHGVKPGQFLKLPKG